MIEIIFSYVNRIKNRINNIVQEGAIDMYGSGELGNVYYGSPSDSLPTFLTWDHVNRTQDYYYLPLTRNASFKNLYIDSGVYLASQREWTTITVKDTLYLRGALSASNTHSGAYFKTGVVPSFLPNLKAFGETNYLINEPFCITGGTNNPCFGNSQFGGGFLALYYTSAKALASETDSVGADLPELNSYVNVKGGTLHDGTNHGCGGCLIIAARNVVIAPTGRIENYGNYGDTTAGAGLFCPYKITARTDL